MATENPAPDPRLRGTDVALLVAFAVLAGLGSLIYPFGRDQGNYAYAGWVWLDGGALYRDVFVFKPPATAVLHGIATGLLGRDMSSIRVFDLGWTALTALATGAVVSRLMGRRLTGVLAGCFAAWLYYEQNYWTTAQTDGWMGLPVTLAIGATWAGLRPGAGRGWWALAGLAAAAALSFKYTSAAVALPMGVLLAQAVPRRGWGPTAGAAAGIAAAALLGVGAMAAWLWASGAMPAFIDCQFHLVPGYVTHVERKLPPHWPFTVVTDLVTGRRLHMADVALLAGVPAAWVAVRRGPGRPGAHVVLAWVVAGLASCAAQGKYFGYHYLMAVPPLGAWAAVGFVRAFDALSAWTRRTWVAMAVAAGLLLTAGATSRHVAQYQAAARVALGDRPLERVWRTTGGYKTNDFSLKDDLKLADYVEAHTDPDDRVFLWGFEPLVNYVAGRKTESRFLYNYPFAVSWGNPDYARELMDALRARPPALFVVASKDATPGVTGNPKDSRALFLDFPELRAFVEEGYHLEKSITRFDVYRRNAR